MTANEVLAMLLEGNRRYVAKQSNHSHQDPTRIHELATDQHPVAVILGCSDSRVPPEVKQAKIQVVGARYDLDDGLVNPV